MSKPCMTLTREQADAITAESDRLRAALAAAEAKLAHADKWARFGCAVFNEFWGDGFPGDVEGSTAQEMAVEVGLLRRMTDKERGDGDMHGEFCGWQPEDDADECRCLLPTCADYRPDAARRAAEVDNG